MVAEVVQLRRGTLHPGGYADIVQMASPRAKDRIAILIERHRPRPGYSGKTAPSALKALIAAYENRGAWRYLWFELFYHVSPNEERRDIQLVKDQIQEVLSPTVQITFELSRLELLFRLMHEQKFFELQSWQREPLADQLLAHAQKVFESDLWRSSTSELQGDIEQACRAIQKYFPKENETPVAAGAKALLDEMRPDLKELQ